MSQEGRDEKGKITMFISKPFVIAILIMTTIGVFGYFAPLETFITIFSGGLLLIGSALH